ncbi:hypothetical protein DOTSEDRAFT_68097 [Dothistroma septosporum NZE10]|uniref:Uncharacterized protein n=1 Tax=Dothistroma septosporum (strain NZE10 / CBS 128990) TaxID=675120 RepID=N1Q3J2_DOTSN|nr:hypothetical protein DOTSEDRAFT_68097 [Dothistroma septosporum NZE10]
MAFATTYHTTYCRAVCNLFPRRRESQECDLSFGLTEDVMRRPKLRRGQCLLDPQPEESWVSCWHRLAMKQNTSDPASDGDVYMLKRCRNAGLRCLRDMQAVRAHVCAQVAEIYRGSFSMTFSY